jgi:hypothetical protein
MKEVKATSITTCIEELDVPIGQISKWQIIPALVAHNYNHSYLKELGSRLGVGGEKLSRTPISMEKSWAWCVRLSFQSWCEAGEIDEETGKLNDFNKYFKGQTQTLEQRSKGWRASQLAPSHLLLDAKLQEQEDTEELPASTFLLEMLRSCKDPWMEGGKG